MSNLIFSLQTIRTPGPNGLRALTPDKDGFFRGIPLAVIGQPSRNGVLYDGPAFVTAMTNPNSLFRKSIDEGNLEGEWGHPELPDNERAAITRLLSVDRSNVSHYFSKVWTKQVENFTVVFGDVKPCGPKGQFLLESFLDANRDTAFSLRSATGEPYKLGNGILGKKIMAMCTFDAVGTPGFAYASKRNAIGMESMGYMVEESDYYSAGIESALNSESMVKAVGFEHVNSQQVLDIFGVDRIIIKASKTIEGAFDPETKQVITAKGPVSLFHNLYR